MSCFSLLVSSHLTIICFLFFIGLTVPLSFSFAEPALEGVDPLIAKLQLKIRRVDNEILDAVREQSSSGTKAKEDLDNAMKAIMVSWVNQHLVASLAFSRVLVTCRSTLGRAE